MMNELHYCLLGFTPRRSFLLHSVNPTLDCITGCGNMTRPPLTAGPSHQCNAVVYYRLDPLVLIGNEMATGAG